jgi:hypothetical protein
VLTLSYLTFLSFLSFPSSSGVQEWVEEVSACFSIYFSFLTCFANSLSLPSFLLLLIFFYPSLPSGPGGMDMVSAVSLSIVLS